MQITAEGAVKLEMSARYLSGNVSGQIDKSGLQRRGLSYRHKIENCRCTKDVVILNHSKLATEMFPQIPFPLSSVLGLSTGDVCGRFGRWKCISRPEALKGGHQPLL